MLVVSAAASSVTFHDFYSMCIPASNCPQLKDQSPYCLLMKKARSTQGKVTCFPTTQGSKTQLAGYSFR